MDGSEHFNTVLWTGTSATQSITGFNHTPELLWTKARSNASNHGIIDIVRGTNKLLFADDTSAEYTQAIIDSFDSDGFTTTIASSLINLNGYTYAGWGWKAGGTAVSNTDGSITSQVSANVDAGFSIVSYTGTGSVATIGHGLNSPLDMFIIKNRDRAENWPVYARPAGNGGLFLDATNSYSSSSSFTNNTDPTGGVFTIGTNAGLNVNGEDCIAYCFHSVEGYSKVGSYTGNGSSDGPFVYTGFRPAWIMWKRTDSSTGGEWVIQDTTRREFNPVNVSLYPNLSNAEATGETFRVQDTLSNGFKLRSSAAQCNASGGTYIYLAFAENPFQIR